MRKPMTLSSLTTAVIVSTELFTMSQPFTPTVEPEWHCNMPLLPAGEHPHQERYFHEPSVDPARCVVIASGSMATPHYFVTVS